MKWQMSFENKKNELILPFLYKVNHIWSWDYQQRQTSDKVTFEAAKAINKYKTGVKCATITPDDKRVKEYNLKKVFFTTGQRNIINGTIFREPIFLKIFQNLSIIEQLLLQGMHLETYINQKKLVLKKGRLFLDWKFW